MEKRAYRIKQKAKTNRVLSKVVIAKIEQKRRAILRESKNPRIVIKARARNFFKFSRKWAQTVNERKEGYASMLFDMEV